MEAVVIIADDRPAWMIEEDRFMTCLLHCREHKSCSCRHGWDCKRFGGHKIPRLNLQFKKGAGHA